MYTHSPKTHYRGAHAEYEFNSASLPISGSHGLGTGAILPLLFAAIKVLSYLDLRQIHTVDSACIDQIRRACGIVGIPGTMGSGGAVFAEVVVDFSGTESVVAELALAGWGHQLEVANLSEQE